MLRILALPYSPSVMMPAWPPESAIAGKPMDWIVAAMTAVEMISPQAIIMSISRGCGGKVGLASPLKRIGAAPHHCGDVSDTGRLDAKEREVLTSAVFDRFIVQASLDVG